MSQGFNHFDENGNAVMVDVSGKNITYRTAVATGEIHVGEAIMEAVKEGSVKKGDVLGVARVAGIMGVKRTSELIPMCHPLPIQKCSVDYELDEINGIIRAFCTVDILFFHNESFLRSHIFTVFSSVITVYLFTIVKLLSANFNGKFPISMKIS